MERKNKNSEHLFEYLESESENVERQNENGEKFQQFMFLPTFDCVDE